MSETPSVSSEELSILPIRDDCRVAASAWALMSNRDLLLLDQQRPLANPIAEDRH